MANELGSALGRLRLPMLTFQSDGLLRPYNKAAIELYARENLRDDVVSARPSHPLSQLVNDATKGKPETFRSRRVVTFPSGQEYSVEISYPSEKGPGRWLVLLLEATTGAKDDERQSLQAWNFTVRELCIVRELMSGRTSEEICGSLNIARSTLKTHLASIFTKVGVHNRTALIARLLQAEGATNVKSAACKA
jgi:DNA-binding CsgD family transcriptional regulator